MSGHPTTVWGKLSRAETGEVGASHPRLDALDVVVLDDLGGVQQDRAGIGVLFAFLAERDERRRALVTAELVFDRRDRIFEDPLTTAAAIARVVHRSVSWSSRAAAFARRRPRQAREPSP